MFRVKEMMIDDGSSLIALLTQKDAQELGLYAKDKVEVICSHSKKKVVCDLEIFDCDYYCNLTLEPGEIGLYEKAYSMLNCSSSTIRAKVIPAPKPKSIDAIRKKFHENIELRPSDFELIIQEMLENKYNDITKTFFVLACAAHSMSDDEVIGLTNAMVNAGMVLDFKKSSKDIIVDKHCIGGVPNNRTTMIVIPIIAAAGLKIPKTSSRSITSPAGTADTMEVLADVNVPMTRMHSIVEKIGGCLIWGGGVALSPADDVIIEVEHPLEIDSEGQMIASILSKKKCAGSTHVLIDIPVGPQAKVTSKTKALRLKKRFESVGKAIGLKVLAIISNGEEPIGMGIGPQLEARDVIGVLENNSGAPDDLKEKSLMMAGLIFEMAGIKKSGKGYKYAQEILESGKALEKFTQIRDLQGKKDLPDDAKFRYEYVAQNSGVVSCYHNKIISRIAFVLGAPKDKLAGLKMYKKIGDKVKKGDVLFELFATSELKLEYGKTYLNEHQGVVVVK